MDLEEVKRRLENQDNRCAYAFCRFGEGEHGGEFREGHRIALGYDNHCLVHVECATVAVINSHGRLVKPSRG